MAIKDKPAVSILTAVIPSDFGTDRNLWLCCILTCLFVPSNTLRVTRSAAPSTLDSSSTAPAQLGKKGKEFEFSQLPLKVEFLECSAKGGRGDAGSADIQDLEKWLAKIA